MGEMEGLKEIVSLARFTNYERRNVLRAVKESINNLGRLYAIIKKDTRVFLKINLPYETLLFHRLLKNIFPKFLQIILI